MRFFLCLITGLALLVTPLCANEDPTELTDNELKEYVPIPKSKKDYDTRITLANLLGVPNGFVNGMVNVVTGDFVEHEIDLIVPSATPLTLERSYCSSFGKHGSLSMGWTLNHDKIIHLHHTGKKKTHYEILLNEGMGAIAKFGGHKPIPDASAISSESLDQGVTNCGGEEISGRTNPRNVALNYHLSHSGDFFSIINGSGTRDYFLQAEGADTCEHHLFRTHHPNGNSFFYSYTKHAELALCTLKDSDGKHLHQLSIKRKNIDKKHKKIEVVSEDHKKVAYSIEKIHGQWVLRDVKRSNAPSVHYVYDNVDDDFCEYPRIIRKELPDFRHLAVNYWLRKEVCGHKKIRMDDRRRHRVKFIKEPVGPTEDLIQTYSFKYYPDSYDTTDHNFAGRTDVIDVAGSKTAYHYNAKSKTHSA